MGTSFDEVIDMALVVADDYKLLDLFSKSEEEFLKQCDAFLIRAIPNFFKCRHSLDYDADKREFKEQLTNTEISILADFWVLTWFERHINDVTQFQLKLQTTGSFKNHSEAQNLKEKSAVKDKIRECVYQKINDYEVQDLSKIFAEW